jgi:hypothetical protein
MIEPLQALLRSLGPFETVMYCLARLVERASDGRMRFIRYSIVAQPVPSVTDACLLTGRLRVRAAHRGDPLLRALPRPASVLEERFQNGAECLLAEIDDRFAGCLWISQGRYREDEVRCDYLWEPRALGAWDFDVYVDPSYRMSRAFLRLWQTAHRNLSARGVRWTVSRISSFNPDSLAAHARLGARRIASASFLVCGPLQLALFRTKRQMHISLSRRSVPVMRIPLPVSDIEAQRSVSGAGEEPEQSTGTSRPPVR